jgi:hypothetical protein
MMGEITTMILSGVGIGFAATATMDVLGRAAARAGLVAGAEGRWIGRWYLGMARGTFFHHDIADSPQQPGEERAALVGHYLIGIALAVVYVVGAAILGVSTGSLAAALGYGLATCVFPWFLVYPALGYGAFGRDGPPEMRAFVSSVLNHLFYGVGLWWASILVRLVGLGAP